MSDLIRRQDAIDAVEFGITYAKAFNKSTGEVKELFKEGNKALNEAVERLKELPSTQPEWTKGKWVLHPEVRNIYGGIYIECSECHTKYVVQHLEDEKFCRNCGAEME